MESLLYFLLWAGLIFLMMRFGCGAHIMGHGHGRHGTRDREPSGAGDPVRWIPPETDIDPVCGKTVRTRDAKSAVHDGMVYYFCSRECRERFETAPQLYLGQSGDEQPRQLDHAHG